VTRGQIAQLQELAGCYMTRSRKEWVASMLWIAEKDKQDGLTTMLVESGKATLRRLWHQYRNQIAAMRKNRAKR
jgi:hypothetical protein